MRDCDFNKSQFDKLGVRKNLKLQEKGERNERYDCKI